MKSSVHSLNPIYRPPGKRWSLFWLALPGLVILDAVSIWAAHYLAFQFWMASQQAVPAWEVYHQIALFLALLSPITLGFAQAYRPRWRPLLLELSHLGLGIGLLSVLQYTIVFFFRHLLPYPDFTFSRGVALLSAAMGFGLLIANHVLFRKLIQTSFKYGWGTRQVLVAGADELELQAPHFLLQGLDLHAFSGLDSATLQAKLDSHPYDLVWLRQHHLTPTEIFSFNQIVVRSGAELWLLPTSLQMTVSRQRLAEVGGLPVIQLQQTPLHSVLNRALKRSLDLLVVVLSLALLWPLFLGIALAIRLGSAGPILYRQERISQNGRRFQILKFRTMVSHSEQQSGPVWAQSNDPRTTTIGRFLRRSSLDELPQLLNVLKGEMSFVGPRPERPFFVERFAQEILDYPDRHLVKAGMTGWAQINGLRGDTSIEDRTRYDLYYIENWSLLLDLRIIARSFLAVLRDFLEKRAY